MISTVKTTYLKLLVIGICVGFLNYGTAQLVIQQRWCDGIPANTYIRNISDCRNWIRCNGINAPAPGYCPNPSVFSIIRQRCTIESAADCFLCQNSPSTSYEAVANSCNRYIRCMDGMVSLRTCGIGMGFNPETRRCESKFYQMCIMINETTTSTTVPFTVTSTKITPPTASPRTTSQSTVTISTKVPDTTTFSTVNTTPISTIETTVNTSTVTPTTVTNRESTITSTVGITSTTRQPDSGSTSDLSSTTSPTTLSSRFTTRTTMSSTILYNTTEF